MKTYQLWDEVPGLCRETPVLEYYPAENKKTKATVVILPGGAYSMRAEHEGKGYAEFLNSIGMDAFVCEYRVKPHPFPLPLLDVRRAIRFVRSRAGEFGIDPERIAVMGSSAGGHLAALTSTYKNPVEYEGMDEIDAYPFLPNATILCYAVVCAPSSDMVAHAGSYENLLMEMTEKLKDAVDPVNLVDDTTPTAFIWHTSNDDCVNVINSLRYGEQLRIHHVNYEMHIFPDGRHGLGVAKDSPHVAQWTGLLENWLKEISFLS